MTTAVKAKFFAAARIIVGPPMSMFSITSCSVAPRRRRRALERVEVHAHEVDELDPVLLGGDHVLRVVAQRQQAGVELRVQRLDAAAHDLREAGEVLDRADLEPGLGQLARRAAGRDELDAELGQAAREVDDPALVGHRQQRAADADLARLGHPGAPYSGHQRRHADAPRVLGSTATAPRGDQPDGLAAAARARAAAARRAPRRRPSRPGSSSARWAMIGPVSTPSSTKWTVTPKTFTP